MTARGVGTRRYQVTHTTIYGYSDDVTSSYGRGFLRRATPPVNVVFPTPC